MAVSFPSKSLQSLSNDHVVECYRLAKHLELDADFIYQLKYEIEKRLLNIEEQYNELAYTPELSSDFSPTV
jgi:hypothetical protein